eukprot:scaffold54535_cov65-Phaeocystis_antarctica.AAC.3
MAPPGEHLVRTLELRLRALRGQGDGGARGAQCSDEHGQLHNAAASPSSGQRTTPPPPRGGSAFIGAEEDAAATRGGSAFIGAEEDAAATRGGFAAAATRGCFAFIGAEDAAATKGLLRHHRGSLAASSSSLSLSRHAYAGLQRVRVSLQRGEVEFTTSRARDGARENNNK